MSNTAKEVFDYATKDLIKGGVKEACYIIKARLRGEKYINDEQFYDAIRVVLAHSFETSDEKTKVDFSYCDCDCTYISNYGFCHGEFSVDKSKAKKLCKYYRMEDK